MIKYTAPLALALLVSAAALAGEEPVAIDYSASAPILTLGDRGAKGYPATHIESPTGKVIFSDSSSEFTAAMCGIEGHGKDADLDAGLIDFNVPDPARYAGGSPEEAKDVGKNRYDYHSSVVLGVTLGYKF